MDKDLCEIAIGHCRSELQEIYDRNDYAEAMIHVSTTWSGFIEYIVAGRSNELRSYASFAALRVAAPNTGRHFAEPSAALQTAMLPHGSSLNPEEQPISKHRRRAEELVNIHISDPENFACPLRRVEIVQLLKEELGVTHNQAVGAATKALSAMDAGNPCRNTRRSPVSRSLGLQMKREILRLHNLGLSGAAIGRELGIITRTVNQNILTMRSERRL